MKEVVREVSDPQAVLEEVRNNGWNAWLVILRSRKRMLAGMDGLEEVYIMTETKKGKTNSEMTARWKYEGKGGNSDMPKTTLTLTAHPNDKDYALRAWDAVMRNFTTVREYYGRRL